MKRLMVSECLSQQFTKVLDLNRIESYADDSLFAVFSDSIETGSFCCLITPLDIRSNSKRLFADCIKQNATSTLKPKNTVRQALAIMKKQHVEVMPVLDAEDHLIGVVKQCDLLQALYDQEHSLRLAALKETKGLLVTNKRQKDVVQEAQAQIKYLKRSDLLTGLPNLVQVRNYIKQLLRENKQENARGAVLLLDLDNFKDVNDLLGSYLGDLILQQVAERINNTLRQDDILARKGGDEFVIVLRTLDSANDAIIKAKELLACLARPFLLEGDEVYLTASIGISFYPLDTQNVDIILGNADIALGQAKGVGKNTYQVFMQHMADRIQSMQQMEKRLRKALDNNEFFIHYQPQIDIQNKRIVGMEALLRWNNPELGLIFPNEFIPLAEKTGLIQLIGEWVLHTACADAVRWQKTQGHLRLAVNLSARQFQDIHSQNANQLIKTIQSALDSSGLLPHMLEIEITESVIMENHTAAMATLTRLKDLGLRVSCDDFGTGYSSLNYLKQFPIDTIKIDKSFIKEIEHAPVDIAIIRAILDMAEQLNIDVIAEGVESKAQLDILNRLGCHIVQGFYYSKPLNVDAATQLFEQGLS